MNNYRSHIIATTSKSSLDKIQKAIAEAFDFYQNQLDKLLNEKKTILLNQIEQIEKNLQIFQETRKSVIQGQSQLNQKFTYLNQNNELEILLSKRDLDSLVEFINKTDASTYFDNHILNQSCLLSLIQQLTTYLKTNIKKIDKHLQWIQHALFELDDSDKFKIFIPPLLEQLEPIIKGMPKNENARLIYHFIRKYTKK